MGGRGSFGGSKSVGVESANAKMPKLNGSEKQVSWAESIRHDALANMDILVKTAKGEFGIELPQGGKVGAKAADFLKNDLISTFQNITSASKIIDARKGLTYESLLRRLINLQLAVNRGDFKM